MTTSPPGSPPGPSPELPSGWHARAPRADDVPGLARLVAAHQEAAKGHGGVEESAITALVTGTGSWTRRQLLVEDDTGAPVAWVAVHDRAAGRTVLELTADPDLDPGADVVPALLHWAVLTARALAGDRGLASTQLDASAYAGDTRHQGWLTAAGFRRTRTWLHMTRPEDPSEEFPEHRGGLRVRRVGAHQDGMPVAEDLQLVHRMLEESFADHFNSYRESFPEFVQRLREDPGHRWDHWWIAETAPADGSAPRAVGALVASVLSPSHPGGPPGTYINYIGVHRDARGLGVAKALLFTVLADARARGHDRVDLEVDADSPTGADGLYSALGWTTDYRTESWHLDVDTARNPAT